MWTGELGTQIPAKILALVHRRLLAQASTAAWQDYLMLNALLAVLVIPTTILVHSRFWRRSRSAGTAAASAPAQPIGPAFNRQYQRLTVSRRGASARLGTQRHEL